MRLVSWNVNGIRAVARKGLFAPFLASLEPDIVCLQETKAQQSQAEIDVAGYQEYWNSAEKKGYSGTAIFSKAVPSSVSATKVPKLITVSPTGRLNTTTSPRFIGVGNQRI